MQLSNVSIIGFRNFKAIEVNLNSKSLFIGPNDVGKSNFIYALRILLDKHIAESELEPLDSDFFAFEETNRIEITLTFIHANEDCIRSKFRAKY